MSADWTKTSGGKKDFRGNRALANEEQIRQILQNLLTNALQSMEGKGSIRLEIRTVRLEDEKNYAEIKITDDGCGIEERIKKRFLSRFLPTRSGTGLGLAIVNRMWTATAAGSRYRARP